MNAVRAEKIVALSGHSGAVYTLEKGPEPHLIFSGSGDQLIAQWDLAAAGATRFSAKVNATVYSICYVHEKGYLIVGDATGGIKILDLKEKKEIKYFVVHNQPIFDIKYAPKADVLIAVSGDGCFSAWSLNTLDHRSTVKVCDEKLRGVDINTQGNEMAIACGDSSIRIFDLPMLKEKQKLGNHEHSVYAVKYHPNGRYLLSGARDAHLNIWNMDNNFHLEHHIPAHNFAIYSIVFSPDNNNFATGSRDKTVKIWDAQTFEMLLRIDKDKFDGHINSVNKLLWSSHNNYLVSTGDDRAIIIWEITNE